jgi:hypothetical protein
VKGFACAVAATMLLAAIMRPINWDDLLTDLLVRGALVLGALWVVS